MPCRLFFSPASAIRPLFRRLLNGSVRSGGQRVGRINDICNITTRMIVVSMPEKQTASRLSHAPAAARATTRGAFPRILCHGNTPGHSRSGNRLQDTPYAANFTKCDADFTESLTTSIPTIIGDGYRATIPAASAPPRSGLVRQALEQQAARLFRPRIARIIRQVKQVAKR